MMAEDTKRIVELEGLIDKAKREVKASRNAYVTNAS